ncbi:MAG: Gfo/Idh/MocA family protein [Eubacteriales bacterium]
MLKAGLIGIGAMGRGHLDNYIRFTKEGEIIQLVAVCDVDESKFSDKKIEFNLNVGDGGYDFSKFNCYTDADEMLINEQLDMVTIALPTYLHCEYAVKFLKAGVNVLCEKPMALDHAQCQEMIDAAAQFGKRLMIGQCLRFWGEYETLKELVVSGSFGKPIGGYFFRGGGTPLWSWNNWLLKRECGGGALLDQHVHDVDMINWLFGMPKAVSSLGYVYYEGSGYDNVTTNYIFDEPKSVNAQDDWKLSGDMFSMVFRVNFENGSVFWDNGKLSFCPKDGKPYEPVFDRENAYYKETRYFANSIINGTENTVNPPQDSRDTIRIITAEIKSADLSGQVVAVE